MVRATVTFGVGLARIQAQETMTWMCANETERWHIWRTGVHRPPTCTSGAYARLEIRRESCEEENEACATAAIQHAATWSGVEETSAPEKDDAGSYGGCLHHKQGRVITGWKIRLAFYVGVPRAFSKYPRHVATEETVQTRSVTAGGGAPVWGISGISLELRSTNLLHQDVHCGVSDDRKYIFVPSTDTKL